MIESLRTALPDAIERALRTLGPVRTEEVEALREAACTRHDELAGLKGMRRFEHARGFTASQISLVHEDELAFSIELDGLARSLRNRCGAELAELHAAYSTLIDAHDVTPDKLPVGPETVCHALRAFADAALMPAEARMRLLDDIADPLTEQLRALYAQFSATLAAAGIAPRLKPSRAAAGKPAPAPPSAADPTPPSTGSGPAAEAAAGPVTDPVMALRQQLSTRLAEATTTPSGLDPVLAAAILTQVREWLAGRQQAREGEVRLSGSGLVPLLPARVAGAVEAVEQVFSVIDHHPALSPRIRRLLSTLQVPLLRLVLDDPDAIGDPAHPARRLVDGLAKLGMRLPDAPHAEAQHRELSAIASRLQRQTTPDAHSFATALEQLQTVTTVHDSACQQQADAFIDQASRLDRREYALHVTSRALARMIEPRTPEPIQAFLWTWWVQVLARTLYRLGDKDPQWRDQLDAVHQLVISGRTVIAPQERARRVAMLPPLVARLKAGLARVGLDAAACERVLADCLDLHSALLAGKPAPIAPEPSTPPLPELIARPEDGLQLLGTGQVIREYGKAITEPATLDPDALVEIELPGREPLRAELRWTGPYRQVALLRDLATGQVIATGLKSLARLIAARRARTINDHDLFADAAAQLLRQPGAGPT